MAQRNILDVFATALHRRHLPLILLFSSRPEQHISLAFNAGLLWELSTRVALDEPYIPDNDIRLFLGDKFAEIKATHRLRAYIPLRWPSVENLEELIRRSSGQFIYASTVIRYISPIHHRPHHRWDIVLGTRSPQRQNDKLPLADLDALLHECIAFFSSRLHQENGHSVFGIFVFGNRSLSLGTEALPWWMSYALIFQFFISLSFSFLFVSSLRSL